MSDARAAVWSGIPSAVIGLPLRGKHGPLETVDLRDAAAAVTLLLTALKRPLPDLARG
jgi:Cellulase M and related proteins